MRQAQLLIADPGGLAVRIRPLGYFKKMQEKDNYKGLKIAIEGLEEYRGILEFYINDNGLEVYKVGQDTPIYALEVFVLPIKAGQIKTNLEEILHPENKKPEEKEFEIVKENEEDGKAKIS